MKGSSRPILLIVERRHSDVASRRRALELVMDSERDAERKRQRVAEDQAQVEAEERMARLKENRKRTLEKQVQGWEVRLTK